MDLDEKIRWTETILGARDAGEALDDFASAVRKECRAELRAIVAGKMQALSETDLEHILLSNLLDELPE